MKSKCFPVLAMAGLFSGFALVSQAAGPLAPPAAPGNPAADMPSLEEVRTAAYQGRTPIAGSTSTVTISQPGSYVLTGNITVGAVDGIAINANDVTLDLNGFTIATTSSDVGAYRGIFIHGNNIVIRNGRIKGNFQNDAGTLIGGGFAAGVEGDLGGPALGKNIVCEDLQIIGCQIGIRLYHGEGNHTVRRCTVHHGQEGILLHALPAGFQNMVSDCQVVQCVSTGIAAGLVTNCAVIMNGTSSPTPIYASLAIGCRTEGGTNTTGNQYNMP